ncbi:MFS transporter [Flaviflexus huanghaiensis]|uniref:MFS transporter n=1 Tax=Flaviflexus huanghaiensis TaxID=1111473 RepID=UPI0015F8C3C2|nr:MFS transporter [Flaviflexus huanghaiensis]
MDTAQGSTSIWLNRNYVWWLAGDTTGMIGRVFSLLIVSFVVFDLTGSEASAGTLQTIILALMMLAAIPGGVIVDRMDRRTLIYLYALLGAAVSGGICLFIYSGNLTYVTFAVLMGVLALVHGFFGEATNAALRSIMSDRDFVKAQAANQGRDAAVQLIARPLTGFFYGLFAWLPFLMSMIFSAIQGFVFTRVRTSLVPAKEMAPGRALVGTESSADTSTVAREARHAAPVKRASMSADFAEGLRYLTSRRTLLVLALIVTVVNLGMAGVQSLMMLSLIARGYPAVEVGYLGMGIGLGVILSSTVAGRIAGEHPTGVITATSLGWFTLATLPLLLSDGYWVMMGVSFAIGLCLPIINAALLGYVLGRTPESFQGRVSSILGVVAQGLSAFAPLIAGVSLETYGYERTAIIFVAICALGAIIAILSPRVRRIPRPSEWESYDRDEPTQGPVTSAEVADSPRA